MRKLIFQWIASVAVWFAIHNAYAGESLQSLADDEIAAAPSIVDLQELTSNYKHHKGERVRVSACLAVSHHGMMLTNCGKRGRLVNFSPINATANDEVEKIIQAGFRVSRREISEVRLCLEGVFDYESNNYPIFHLRVAKVLELVERIKGE